MRFPSLTWEGGSRKSENGRLEVARGAKRELGAVERRPDFSCCDNAVPRCGRLTAWLPKQVRLWVMDMAALLWLLSSQIEWAPVEHADLTSNVR